MRQPSIIFEACARFDVLKAIGVSRYHLRRRLRAAANALRTAADLPLPPAEHDHYYGQNLVNLRQALGDHAFEDAWAGGQALSVDHIVAEVLASVT